MDRVFFFGDLNYRVDLSRADLELGVSVCRQEQAAEEGNEGGQGEDKGGRRRIGGRFRPGELGHKSGRHRSFRALNYNAVFVLDPEVVRCLRLNIYCCTCTIKKSARFWGSQRSIIVKG